MIKLVEFHLPALYPSSASASDAFGCRSSRYVLPRVLIERDMMRCPVHNA